MKNYWNLKLNNLLLLIGLFAPVLSSAQFSLSKEIPPFPLANAEPYLFPINPGTQNYLAGTMGELRNTHFHAGIDIRTNNMAGVPVRASQNGYISRAIVGSYGYGQALFITHPDGNISVYAHLDQFKGKVAGYILSKHYEQKSFDLDLEFAPNQFPVNRGDTVAFSGNTGGSSGPHLHFEIRDDKNEALNPLNFKFDEIKDALPPVAQKIAIKPMGIDSRINGHNGRTEFHLLRSGSRYFVADIEVTGKIGIELLAFDRMDFSQFRCGINEIEMLVDSQKVFSQKIDKVNFDKSHSIVSLLDFQTLKTRGLRFNKLYIDDGNPLKYYEQGLNQGEINVTDKPLNIQINLKDAYGNQSTIQFRIKPSSPAANLALTPLSKPFEYEIAGNILSLHVKACNTKGKITLYEKGDVTTLEPNYQGIGHEVYLIDLQKIIPDSATTCQGIVPFHLTDNIPSNIEYTYYSDLADIHFNPNSLYDTLYLNIAKELKGKSEIISIGRATVPLNNPIEITLKQLEDSDHSKMSVYHIEGRSYEFIGGTWQRDRIQFTAAELGDFVILEDTIAPLVHRIQCHQSSARFRIMDNLSGIGSYSATINGEWLLMKYDYKTGIIQSERLDKSKPLKGDFELRVSDKAGNEKTYTQKIF